MTEEEFIKIWSTDYIQNETCVNFLYSFIYDIRQTNNDKIQNMVSESIKNLNYYYFKILNDKNNYYNGSPYPSIVTFIKSHHLWPEKEKEFMIQEIIE